MKKIIMTLTLALAAVVALPSLASAQDVTNGSKACQEQCQNKDCKKGDRKGCKKGGKKFAKDGQGKCCKDSVSMRMIGGKKGNPLMKGITLTPEQEQKMTALMNERRADKAKLKEAQNQDKAQMKAKYREEMQKNQESLDKEVQKILSADQYKQYEANKANMKQGKGQKSGKGQMAKAQRNAKKMNKAQSVEKVSL